MKAPPAPADRMRSVRHAISRIPRAARYPRAAFAFLRVRRDLRRDAKRARFSTREHTHLVRTREEAIRELFGMDAGEQERLLASAAFPEMLPFDQGAWSSRAPWLELIHLTVSAIRPTTVVETGVQWGYSTAVILAALRDGARLESVDLPNLDPTSRERHAAAVPEAVRDRWTLHLGDCQRTLPGVLESCRPLDIFIHDSDHTYAGQMYEFEASWPTLRPGGVILVDDVWHSALIDFADAAGAPGPLLIERTSDQDALGILRKPRGRRGRDPVRLTA